MSTKVLVVSVLTASFDLPFGRQVSRNSIVDSAGPRIVCRACGGSSLPGSLSPPALLFRQLKMSGVEADAAKRRAITANQNLAVLRRLDPAVNAILSSSSQVAVYNLPVDAEGLDAGWKRCDIEGSLYIVSRDVEGSNQPCHRVVIVNRKTPVNFSGDITQGGMKFDTADQMIMFQDSDNRVTGLWFYVAEEIQPVLKCMTAIVDGNPPPALSPPPLSPPPPRASVSVPFLSPPLLPAAAPAMAKPTAKPSKPSKANGVCSPTTPEKSRPQQENSTSGKKTRAVAKASTAAAASMDSVTAQPSASGEALAKYFPNLKLTNGVAGMSPPASAVRAEDVSSVHAKSSIPSLPPMSSPPSASPSTASSPIVSLPLRNRPLVQSSHPASPSITVNSLAAHPAKATQIALATQSGQVSVAPPGGMSIPPPGSLTAPTHSGLPIPPPNSIAMLPHSGFSVPPYSGLPMPPSSGIPTPIPVGLAMSQPGGSSMSPPGGPSVLPRDVMSMSPPPAGMHAQSFSGRPACPQNQHHQALLMNISMLQRQDVALSQASLAASTQQPPPQADPQYALYHQRHMQSIQQRQVQTRQHIHQIQKQLAMTLPQPVHSYMGPPAGMQLPRPEPAMDVSVHSASAASFVDPHRVRNAAPISWETKAESMGTSFAAVAPATGYVDNSAVFDRNQFRGLLHRTLSDRKLFEVAFSAYTEAETHRP